MVLPVSSEPTSNEPIIRSRANPELKRLGAVRAGKLAGDLARLVVLEGERLVRDALASGLEFERVFIAEGRTELATEFEALGLSLRRVEDGLLGRISALSSSPGILALVRAPEPEAGAGLAADPDALVLVVAGVSDPGNLGAIARSAEAAGARAICVVSGGASPFNEKALRGSMGSLLRLPVHRFESARAVFEALGGHRHVRAATRGGDPWRRFDWSGPVALWVSSETGEPVDGVADEDFEPVTIPMAAGPESLNVTVAASLLLFAAGRVELADAS